MSRTATWLSIAATLTIFSLTVPSSSQAAWYSYATNASGISAYTFVSVVNIGNKEETVTVEFHSSDGAALASTSSALAPQTSLTASSSSGFTNAVATGDFSGYVIVSSTGSDKKLAVTGAFLTPTSGNGGIGNALAVSGHALTWTRGKLPK